ncbi:MAG: hypothetical protein HOW97_02140 [Catenulispora sp.]|nr:hypothetical protein [Catenulispora sp.]
MAAFVETEAGPGSPRRIPGIPAGQRTRLRAARIAVVGGGEPHRPVVWPTIERIVDTLISRGYKAELVDAEQPGFVTRIQDYDLAYVAHFGTTSDKGSLQGLLAELEIPYTGSGCLAMQIARNKVVSKQLFRQAGLLTPDFVEVDLDGHLAQQAADALARLGGALMVKPVYTDGSYGLALASTVEEVLAGIEDATKFGPLFLEKFVQGKTLTAGVVGTGHAAIGLPAHEVRFIDDKPFLDPVSLFTPGTSETVIPPRVAPEIALAVEEAARRAHAAIGAWGMSRCDFKVDADGGPWLLEINTLPAMSARSDLPIAGERAGLSYADLVETILASALDRPEYTP